MKLLDKVTEAYYRARCEDRQPTQWNAGHFSKNSLRVAFTDEQHVYCPEDPSRFTIFGLPVNVTKECPDDRIILIADGEVVGEISVRG